MYGSTTKAIAKMINNLQELQILAENYFAVRQTLCRKNRYLWDKIESL